MLHDDLCEQKLNIEQTQGPKCHCASRAYDRDPLRDDLVPIYVQKMPRLEGVPS